MSYGANPAAQLSFTEMKKESKKEELVGPIVQNLLT